MNSTVIIMLVIGAILAVAGYVLPEKKTAKTDTRKAEEKIQEYTQQLMKDVQSQIEDTTDDSVQYAVEKTERALDRLTNEKMQAVHEYSDTVLKEINRNHEEVMFLYDMLNDKQKQIKNTVAEVSKAAQKAQEDARDAQLAAEAAAQVVITEKAAVDQSAEEKKKKTAKTVKPVQEDSAKKPAPTKKAGTAKAKETANKDSQTDNISIQFATGDGIKQNNNMRILELHNMGKSNMAVAKELGLGIGEVKLVIDLFEGM